MAAGPSAGPASAYPTLKTPASIYFTGSNEVRIPDVGVDPSVDVGTMEDAFPDLVVESRDMYLSLETHVDVVWLGKAGATSARLPGLRLTKRAEGRPELGGEELRLFPGREVCAFGQPVVMD